MTLCEKYRVKLYTMLPNLSIYTRKRSKNIYEIDFMIANFTRKPLDLRYFDSYSPSKSPSTSFREEVITMPRKGENIYKRKDGRWEGRYIRTYDEAGKAQYAYIYGKTYGEVKQKLANERNNPKKASITTRSLLTYNEFLDSWLHLSQLNTKESTYARYAHLINTF